MAVQCVNIISLFLQNVVIIYSVQTLLAMEDEEGIQSQQELDFKEWLRVEVIVFISYIAASIVFLFVRSLYRH